MENESRNMGMDTGWNGGHARFNICFNDGTQVALLVRQNWNISQFVQCHGHDNHITEEDFGTDFFILWSLCHVPKLHRTPCIFTGLTGEHFSLVSRVGGDDFKASEFFHQCHNDAHTLTVILDPDWSIFDCNEVRHNAGLFEKKMAIKKKRIIATNPHIIPANGFVLNAEGKQRAIFLIVDSVQTLMTFVFPMTKRQTLTSRLPLSTVPAIALDCPIGYF
jgi:hypothetical protein